MHACSTKMVVVYLCLELWRSSEWRRVALLYHQIRRCCFGHKAFHANVYMYAASCMWLQGSIPRFPAKSHEWLIPHTRTTQILSHSPPVRWAADRPTSSVDGSQGKQRSAGTVTVRVVTTVAKAANRLRGACPLIRVLRSCKMGPRPSKLRLLARKNRASCFA